MKQSESRFFLKKKIETFQEGIRKHGLAVVWGRERTGGFRKGCLHKLNLTQHLLLLPQRGRETRGKGKTKGR